MYSFLSGEITVGGDTVIEQEVIAFHVLEASRNTTLLPEEVAVLNPTGY